MFNKDATATDISERESPSFHTGVLGQEKATARIDHIEKNIRTGVEKKTEHPQSRDIKLNGIEK